ncbi:Sec-independent protein translocase protein TatB [Halomonas llamarensis]|uniref:Sec-independent protein translocase protein TatB n=1 Tax=Halomonas llamarensis TaxID=2945104 RepID=A0ABT0SL33_9GAMM|nr:Sec-independent protein translocase protein TatB [Halomonas llamarensis]MCL7928508.1 Sec-independent protein translocase protein TatB [Halomonas llamarensis]
MLDIGFLELLIIAVVGLLVLGPERLPRAARTAGLWVGKIKRTVSGMQREISSQLEAEELRQKLNDQQKSLDDSLKKAKQDVESLAEAPPASQKEEKNLADATARLDDALNTVREDTPSEAPKTPSSSQPEEAQQGASQRGQSQKAQSQKDEEQR